MNNSVATPFDNHFHISKAKIDSGLLLIEEGEKFSEVKAYFDYEYAVDVAHRRELEVVEIKSNKSVVLPKSVRNRSKVTYAGVRPIFASLDKHYNLITFVFVGCVIRVEYLGKIGIEKKVKYFKSF